MTFAALLLAGCGQPTGSPQTISVDEPTNSEAAAEIERLHNEVVDLTRQLDRAKRKLPPVRAAAVAARPAKRRRADMCYKDYCPCTSPQEGMDSIICDQLEAGIDVPVETMIAGRGGREYRRQAAALGM